MVVFRKAMSKFGHRLRCENPRHILPRFVIVAKTFVQHGVARPQTSLQTRQPRYSPSRSVSSIHSLLPVTQGAVAHRAVILSSFGQIENRQLLHFFLAASE